LNPVDQILLAPVLDTIEAFSSEMIGRILKDANGNVLGNREIRWTSSNPAVAAIDPITGMLTGVDRGTVTVSATSEGKSATVTRVVVIKYRSISAGTMHACDIASGGIVWCWGLNGAEGRLGSPQLGETSMSSIPTKLPGNLRFAQLSTYGRHTCGITLDGKAYCWGYNGWGALGSGSNATESATPMAVAGNVAFRSISAGSDHTCGVTTTNQAYCWGANSIGQIGDGGKISYGNAFVAAPQQVVGGKAFQSVTLGNQFACAVTTTGEGHCWGSNNSKLGNGPTGTDSSSPVQVAGGLLFQSISSGYGHSCGVTTSQQVYCWGLNGSGQLGSGVANGSTPVRSSRIEAIEVAASGIGTGSGAHSCAISANRLTVWCWGRNDTGQLGNGSTTAAATANPNPGVVVTQKPL